MGPEFASAPAEAVRVSHNDGRPNPPPPPTAPPHPHFCFPRLFLAAKQDRLAYIIREVDAKAWEFWGCVVHFAKLDSPTIWEVANEISEKCDT